MKSIHATVHKTIPLIFSISHNKVKLSNQCFEITAWRSQRIFLTLVSVTVEKYRPRTTKNSGSTTITLSAVHESRSSIPGLYRSGNLSPAAYPACNSVMSPMMTTSYTALDNGWQLTTFSAKTEHATSMVPSINVCRTACAGSPTKW